MYTSKKVKKKNIKIHVLSRQIIEPGTCFLLCIEIFDNQCLLVGCQFYVRKICTKDFFN